MFFKKEKNALPESALPPAPLEENSTAPILYKFDQRPIYILGLTGLGYFLAARFLDAGERVILLSPHGAPTENNGIYIKEELSLRRQKYNFEYTSVIPEEAKMLIIATSAYQLKSSLMSLAPGKLKNTPVLNFTYSVDDAYLRGYLNTGIINAYCSSLITADSHQVTILGENPQLEISGNIDGEDLSLINYLFGKTRLDLNINLNEEESFWKHFAPYAIASLFAASCNQNVYNITKNKEKRELLEQLCTELDTLLKAANIPFDREACLQKISDTPNGYSYPLQKDVKNFQIGEFEIMMRLINKLSERQKIKLPSFKLLFQNISKIILA